ncbi:hypothetical protein MASR1M32_23580 [Rhodobacter sp.]
MLSCFKAYDIRGCLGEDLDEDIARRIGRAFALVLGARKVCVGRDCRTSSEALMAACVEGLLAAGAQVLDLGLCGTEEMYHAVTHFAADGGIEITASHNPMDYNGMKMVRAGSAPLEPAVMRQVHDLADGAVFPAEGQGQVHRATGARAAYVVTVAGFADPATLRPLHILVNCGNGAAGPTFDALAEELGVQGPPFAIPGCITSRMAASPTASRTRFCPKTSRSPPKRSARPAPTLASPSTAISTAASSSTRPGPSSPANMSWRFWPRPSLARSRAPRSSTTRA